MTSEYNKQNQSLGDFQGGSTQRKGRGIGRGMPQRQGSLSPYERRQQSKAAMIEGSSAKLFGRINPNNQDRQSAQTQKGRFQSADQKQKAFKKRNPQGKAQKRGYSPLPRVKITFLGGLNEIGKNITLFECDGDMFLRDCGMAFPDGEMLGVDLVLPDFTYIERNKDKIKGIVLTHGHEDHIGALPYLLRKLNIPMYGTSLTLGLVGSKLKEHNLQSKAKMNVVKPGQRIKLGCMTIEFIHVNHSIPDAVGLAIHTPGGTIIHTGDFKIDCTPITGDMIDLARFGELGNEGVLALMADSTNAERPGYTVTEQKVVNSFEMFFREAEKERIIIATFASNIGRVEQIIKCAARHGRKVAFSGRSMINYMTIATELGYVDIPDGVVIDIDMLNKYPKEQIVLITTGSQASLCLHFQEWLIQTTERLQ